MGFERPRKFAVPGQRQGSCSDFLNLVCALQFQLDGTGLQYSERLVIGSPVQGQLGGGAGIVIPGRVERPASPGLVGGGGGNVGVYVMIAGRKKRPAVGPEGVAAGQLDVGCCA